MDGGAQLRVTVLGAFQATRGDTTLPVPGARSQSLLVRLALAGGRPVEQATLVDAIWPEDPPTGPAHALQTLISRLRRTLGSPDHITQGPGGYRLHATDVDALRFEQLAATGRDHLRTGDPHAAAAVLGEAVALWNGRPGEEPAAVAAVAPATATWLAHASIEAVTDLAEAELSLGHADTAANRLSALLAEHPVHERAAALLMDALAAQGRQAEALTLYERVRQSLADALGADPGTALHERHQRLLRAEPPAPDTAPTNLPAPLTSFIGRDDDLARIDTLLSTARLVTVLGPGGAGKTRLAVEAARRHRHHYRDGAWMIDLASVTEPAKVGAAVLAGTGLRASAMFEARTRPEGDELDTLIDQLGGRESLLLVDNCEHLIDAVAHLLAALLPRCPGLRVLATSREPLTVDGETLVPLGPLPLPGPDDGVEQARQAASVRLFTERAAAVRPGFDLDDTTLPDIRRIVRSLDGMPLALELAAARLRTLSLPELADGLSDRFQLLSSGSRTALPRHRTLRAVITWSWDLLNEHERTVAERVSILPGGLTPASATAVCAGTAVPAEKIPELLASLVDRSLLQLAPDPGRYRMLETLREYGTARLADTGDLPAARDLAADHFAELIARNDPQLRGPGQLTAMKAISADYDNTLAALRRRCDTGDSPGAIALALNLTWYWQLLGRHPDATYWLGQALALPAATPTPEHDCAHTIYLFNQGQNAEHAQIHELADRLLTYPQLPNPHSALTADALAYLHEDKAALTIMERLADGDDAWLSAAARMYRAQLAENTGELDKMRPDLETALTGFRQTGDRWGQAATLAIRSQLRQYNDDLDGALADVYQARTLAAEFGSLSLGDEVFRDLRLIDLHLRRGDTALATAMIDSARERAQRAASQEMQVLLNTREADFRVRLGDLNRARQLLDDAEQGLHSNTTFPTDHARTLAANVRTLLHLQQGDLTSAQKMLTTAYTAALQTRDLPILSLVAINAAALAQAHGHHHDSAILLGAASRLRGAHDRTDPQIRDLTRQGNAALGEQAFTAAYQQGWELDTKTAVTAVHPRHYAERQ